MSARLGDPAIRCRAGEGSEGWNADLSSTLRRRKERSLTAFLKRTRFRVKRQRTRTRERFSSYFRPLSSISCCAVCVCASRRTLGSGRISNSALRRPSRSFNHPPLYTLQQRLLAHHVSELLPRPPCPPRGTLDRHPRPPLLL